jgi:hypothetical protein
VQLHFNSEIFCAIAISKRCLFHDLSFVEIGAVFAAVGGTPAKHEWIGNLGENHLPGGLP